MALSKKLTYAIRGFFKVIMAEQTVRIHLTIGLLVLFAAIWLNLERTDLAIIVIIVFSLIILEGLNTVLEKTVDLAEPRYREPVKQIKDAMAGLVLLASLGAVAAGVIVFWPYLSLIK